jgi:DNA-binding response OmpR family regulator
LIYSELQHYPGQGRVVGTYLAIKHIVDDKSMTDLHSPASNKTIMVVDDNPDTVTLVKTILKGNGYGVQTAYNGMEVFSRLEEQKPDLIILDIMMPHMDGLEVLERLKGTAETSSIPVILLTALIRQEDMIRGRKLGVDYYIFKPFSNTHLINVVNFILMVWELNGELEHSIQANQVINA